MSSATLMLQISGLGKTRVAKLRRLAKQSGLTTESFAKELIEDGLSIRESARSKTFDELLAPVRSEFKRSGMTETELDTLVDAARTRHHKRNTKKRR